MRNAIFISIILQVACIDCTQAAQNNSLLDISRDGKRLACANRDSGTVTLLDLPALSKRAEIPVGAHPEGVTFIGDSYRIAVAVYGEDKVAIVDTDAEQVVGRVEVFDEPYGVVSDRAGQRLYVTLDYPGQVVEIDVDSLKVLRSMEAGAFARGLALSPAEDRVLVTRYYEGSVVAIDLKSGELTDHWPGISNDNLARQLVVHPHRAKAYVPHIRSRVTAVHGEGSIFPYVSVIDTAPGADKRRRLPMDAFQGNLVTCNPWDAAISPDGKDFYVVFAGTDDMFACNVIEDDYRELAPRGRVELGHNPRAVRVSPDGGRVYVYNALDFSVAAYDAKGLKLLDTAVVTECPLTQEQLRGKILFYSAKQPMVGRRWISCASCHPDGDPDGRTWHNAEGLRNTQALAGLAWTHPIHWSADRDEVQDFEHTIRGQLMQGRGLIEGAVGSELGPANKGRSPDLDALAAYVNSHSWSLSPHGKGGLSEAARRGKELFFSAKVGCAECHSGPFYSDSTPEKPQKHDVGTGGGTDEKLGAAYDTPSLLGLYRTAPFLHHGKAAHLLDVLTTLNPDDRHGKTSHLTQDQLQDLVEFLKALPYEDPEPRAKQAGLTRISR